MKYSLSNTSDPLVQLCIQKQEIVDRLWYKMMVLTEFHIRTKLLAQLQTALETQYRNFT